MPYCKYQCPHDALTSIAFTPPCMAYQTTMFCRVMSLDWKKWKSPQDSAELPLIYPLKWVVRSINVQYLLHPHRHTSLQSIVLINQSDSEVKIKQINNGQNLNILRGLLWALKLGLFSLSKGKRCGEIDREANHKRVESGKVSRWMS